METRKLSDIREGKELASKWRTVIIDEAAVARNKRSYISRSINLIPKTRLGFCTATPAWNKAPDWVGYMWLLYEISRLKEIIVDNPVLVEKALDKEDFVPTFKPGEPYHIFNSSYTDDDRMWLTRHYKECGWEYWMIMLYYQKKLQEFGVDDSSDLTTYWGLTVFPSQSIPPMKIVHVTLAYHHHYDRVAKITDELLQNVSLGPIPETDNFDESVMNDPDEKAST
ncbi:hypothetical protein QBC40DRAFT_302318 [Triangularia verruculosa]|uniref:Uncharacterized protein n=1 Tax=Triangularia verruculosa TaxID=2587418 RepID=A0AAN6X536_9PEZI|nr:hypothetical protein QBC40DRAFT_302318 [Triangularia verruculosa]